MSWLVFYTALEWALIAVSFVCLFKAFPATNGFAFRDVLVFMGFVAFEASCRFLGWAAECRSSPSSC